MLTLTSLDIIIKIACAIGLGSIIGLERTFAGKGAGMRTYAMVSLGSSIFIIISEIVLSQFPTQTGSNSLGVVSAIITGIGFIGAGLTIFKEHGVTGLTTAAGLWVAAGVGIASGFGYFNIAIIATIAALLVFTVMWFLESTLKKFSYYKDEKEN
jgi:putative Mg2+ transporter-C (MgtC) family protein